MSKASDEELRGNEKSPEKVGIFTPELSPEDLGEMSPGEWLRRHSSDTKIEKEKGE